MKTASLTRFREWIEELKVIGADEELAWRREVVVDAMKWAFEKLPESEQQEAKKLCDGLVQF